MQTPTNLSSSYDVATLHIPPANTTNHTISPSPSGSLNETNPHLFNSEHTQANFKKSSITSNPATSNPNPQLHNSHSHSHHHSHHTHETKTKQNEDNKSSTSSNSGKSFKKVSVSKHALRMDLS